MKVQFYIRQLSILGFGIKRVLKTNALWILKGDLPMNNVILMCGSCEAGSSVCLYSHSVPPCSQALSLDTGMRRDSQHGN
jgi:hypothetical protein